MPKAKPIVIAPDNNQTVEMIASDISRIASGVKALRRGPLNERALILLIQHAAPFVNGKPISQGDIKRVLVGLDDLASAYLRK